MPRIAHDNAQVVCLGESQSGDNIGMAPHAYGVADIVTQGAGLGSVGKRVAALVGEIRLHHRRGRGDARVMIKLEWVSGPR